MPKSAQAGEEPVAEGSPSVWLVGAGVVGRAILQAHLDAGVPASLADVDQAALRVAAREAELPSGWAVRDVAPLGGELPAVRFQPAAADSGPASDAGARRDGPAQAQLLIESIVERLEVKRAFFAKAERWFGERDVLCSNTSTIKIGSLASGMRHPERIAGMHFFMPVRHRNAVEVIASNQTDKMSLAVCRDHARRLGKRPLEVVDGPGFVVNRLLSPYLNQAMLLVTQGAEASRIDRAAEQYGMPFSPFALVDLIGARTAFDAGRVYWQAFPERIDPAPLLPAMVKRNRLGRAVGRGFYDYPTGTSAPDHGRNGALAAEVTELCERYGRHKHSFSDDDLVDLLAIPMWIEAACLQRDHIVTSDEAIETAMSGGLGYTRPGRWFDFFRQLGDERIGRAVDHWSPSYRAMRVPEGLQL